jgi:starch phosphorylase
MQERPRIAYFSMEIALESPLPTYAGGLGVLAGDTLRSCADLGLPVVAVSLVYRKGYFRQRFTAEGEQRELPYEWTPEQHATRVEPRVRVEIGGDPVEVQAWRYAIVGVHGHEVPVYLLDTDLPTNPEHRRDIASRLYQGDSADRLAQELLLGVGGVRMLRALGYDALNRFHMNEGHAALAIPELMREAACEHAVDAHECAEEVRQRCVFTTHTPVPAGHDAFPPELAREVLGDELWERVLGLGATRGLNMTALALEHSRFVNGVAMRHGEVSRSMFPGYPIRSITNGIHPATWAAPAFAALYDRHVEHWKQDPFALRCATAIPTDEIVAAHREAKRELAVRVKQLVDRDLDPDALTLGFGRRSTAYKRPLLVLRDPERLARIAESVGPVQLVFGGKAHPRDREGRAILQELHRMSRAAPAGVSILLLPGYDMDLCRCIVAGSDVWLNTPVPPLEASGTSGMKAALNGVPSLSILDGWWVEGCVEGVTGWAIGEDGRPDPDEATRDRRHAESLYEKLGEVVAPLYYRDPAGFAEVMRQAIAINGSYFHSDRMVLQYLFEAYGGASGERRLGLTPASAGGG